MSLSRKFVIILFISVCSIALVNIFAFYTFYGSFIKLYLSEKISLRETITIEYINSIIEKQTLEDIDNIFNDAELEFFELLDNNDGSIPLKDQDNVNIVVEYLSKSGVSPKYIEEIIPENNLEKILSSLQDSNSPESNFIRRLFGAIVFTNIIALSLLALILFYFTKTIIFPIKKATGEIKNMRPGSVAGVIEYKRKDEIGLLIESINGLNSRLSIQEKIRSRLLADISHELKTPITSIQCYLEGISDGVIELTDKNLDAISSEMRRLTELVNQIMEFEKFENSNISLDKQSSNPYEIIKQIAETQNHSLKDSNQEIVLTGSQNIEIYLDKNLFTQLIYNIIGNFKKYSGDGTTLTIKISSQNIYFSDNGKGISKKEVNYLFEKFYQGKKEKTGNINTRGIGVGLSIVKKISNAHGWDSQIISDTGKGFCYKIKL